MTSSLDSIFSALANSHDRLAAAVSPLSAEEVAGPAYPTEWSIAQVLSHLGSGAEIFSLLLTSGLTGSPAPEQADFMAIWDVWNAKSPADQAADGLAADERFLNQARATTPEQRDSFAVQLFNGEQDLAGMLRMRLGEHTVHTWDVVVALDPTATLASDATALVLDGLDRMVGIGSKPSPVELTIDVQTTEPTRRFGLELDSTGARLTEGTPENATASLALPAEALVRLVYGRLDPDHTPAAVVAEGVELTDLRTVFPGF
jgi:uncharacterized protein (TIGR03083 family)